MSYIMPHAKQQTQGYYDLCLCRRSLPIQSFASIRSCSTKQTSSSLICARLRVTLKNTRQAGWLAGWEASATEKEKFWRGTEQTNFRVALYFR